MKLRRDPCAAVEEISREEFLEGIRSGAIGPKVELLDRVLTDGRWRTVDNLRTFHANAPGDHPAGDHLAAVHERGRQLQARKKEIYQLHKRYWEENSRESLFGIAELPTLAEQPGVVGIGRLWTHPAFAGARVTTLIFRGDEAERIDSVGQTPLTDPNPVITRVRSDGSWTESKADGFDTAAVSHSRSTLPLQGATGPLASAAALLAAARQAGSCKSPVLDGASHTHEVLVGEQRVVAHWSNPHPQRHPRQWELLQAYKG